MFVVSGVAISQPILFEKVKAIPTSLAKIPNLHRIVVSRNVEPRWRYERGSVL